MMKYVLIIHYANGDKTYYANDFETLYKQAEAELNCCGYEIHKIEETIRSVVYAN